MNILLGGSVEKLVNFKTNLEMCQNAVGIVNLFVLSKNTRANYLQKTRCIKHKLQETFVLNSGYQMI